MMRKPTKTKPIKASLVEELSEPLRDFVSDFKLHGKSALETVRERSPEKYLELSTKLLPLVAALNPGASGFSDCQSQNEIAVRLLRSMGVSEFDISEQMVADAVQANEKFVATLKNIAALAQVSEDEIH